MASVRERIAAGVVHDDSDCWLWQGVTHETGYALINVKNTTRRAHRVAYEAFVGPIPDGLTLDHLCRVRHCVNPAHLEPVTMRENLMRGDSPAAVNVRKTHCPKGHPYSGDNLYVFKGRNCRTCRVEATRRWRARQKARADA
jgi:hypothetical protein